jgi:hypothetical protein
MTSYSVEITHRHISRYTVDAESLQDAIERVLAGEGIEGNDEHPEPNIHVKERES